MQLKTKPIAEMATAPTETRQETSRDIPKTIMDCFWGLSEVDDEKRHGSSVKLINNLLLLLGEQKGEMITPASKTQASNLSEVMKYVLKRLVTGLSSNRQAASLGYATTLCEILKQFKEEVDLNHILLTIPEYLLAAKQDSRSHQTHVGLGKILAYTSIIRSGLLEEAAESDLTIIVRAVRKIRTKHTMLTAATTECLSQLCHTVDAEKLSEIIRKELHKELTGGWEKCTPDTLQLLLLLQDKGVLDNQFFLEHWDCEKLTGTKTLKHYAKILLQSTLSHPIVHPVCLNLTIRMLDHGAKVFVKYWKNVVMGEVFSIDKPKRCYMVYQLVPELLKHHVKQQSVSVILCPELIQPLIKHMSHKDTFLHKAANKLASDVVCVVKATEDGKFQLEILKTLMSEPGSFMFDSVTSSRTLSSIISHLTKDAAKELSQDMMHAITHGKSMCGVSGDGLVQWCALTLAHMLTMSSMMSEEVHDWQANILKFLMVHSCFNITKPLADMAHCERSVTLSEMDRNALKDALLKSLSLLSTYQHTSKIQTDGKPTTAFEYSNVVSQLFIFTSELMKLDGNLSSVKDFTEEVVSAWNGISSTCKDIEKNLKGCSGDKSKTAMHGAFQLMLQLFGLNLFMVDETECKEVIETIKELQACYKKSTSRTRSKKQEPEWCEVVTEVLISLMSKSSVLLRTASTNMFSKILPMCNKTSIQLIMDVFMAADEEFDEEDEMMTVDDDANEEDQNASVQEDADDEDESEGSSSDEDDVDDSEESDESDDEVDENVRATIQAALGPAADTQSDEDDVASDLSDSEMFKLDDALSAAFRSMRKQSKNSPESQEKKRQIKHFKLRCLDLVDVIVKHSTKGEDLMELVVPLLTLIEAGYKDSDEMREIGNKSQNIYNHMLANKKLPRATFTDTDAIEEHVNDVLIMSTNANVWPIMKEIAGALNFIIKLLSHADLVSAAKTPRKGKQTGTAKSRNELLNLVTGPVQTALSDFFNKRESKYSHTLFQKLFERQPGLFWSCSTELLTAIGNSDIRVFCRTQGCTLLFPLLQKNVINEDGPEEWDNFVQGLSVATKKVAEYSKENYKQGFLTEFFNLLIRCRNIDREMAIDVVAFKDTIVKGSKEIQRIYRKLTVSSQQTVGDKKKRKSSITSDPPKHPTSRKTANKKTK